MYNTQCRVLSVGCLVADIAAIAALAAIAAIATIAGPTPVRWRSFPYCHGMGPQVETLLNSLTV